MFSPRPRSYYKSGFSNAPESVSDNSGAISANLSYKAIVRSRFFLNFGTEGEVGISYYNDFIKKMVAKTTAIPTTNFLTLQMEFNSITIPVPTHHQRQCQRRSHKKNLLRPGKGQRLPFLPALPYAASGPCF